MNQDVGSIKDRLRRIMEQRTEEIERRWLDRVQQDIVKQPGVELTLLRDGMPDYLLELTKVLGSGADPLDHRAESAWARVARDHGIIRVRIGFDISQLVHEFIVLRRIIQEVVREEDPGARSGAVARRTASCCRTAAMIGSFTPVTTRTGRRAHRPDLRSL